MHLINHLIQNYRGPRGLFRFSEELHRPENSGLEFALEKIEEIKEEGNHITAKMSYTDLVQLGGYTAVEYTGGPVMLFRMGRDDAENPHPDHHDDHHDHHHDHQHGHNHGHHHEVKHIESKENSENLITKLRKMGFST